MQLKKEEMHVNVALDLLGHALRQRFRTESGIVPIGPIQESCGQACRKV
jgi:hypothetical protein